MSIREKAKQLYSKKAIIGWLALIKVVWEWIDNISTVEFAGKYMSIVWGFLSSSAGTMVLLFVGLGFILWAVLRPSKTAAKNIASAKSTLELLEQDELLKRS